LTEEINQQAASGDVDVNAAASQSTTNSDENLEFRTKSPGRLESGTRIFVRSDRKKNEKTDEEGTTPLL
jgi:hypothetical protein